jgi:hypothetical protein
MLNRPEPRYRVDFPVFLAWQDKRGTVHRSQARCLDISASGAHMETIDPFPPQTCVVVHSDGFGRMGHASVRYCRRVGMKYRVGLQFTSALALSDAMRKKFLADAIQES